METQTTDLARAAWTAFTAIEAAGGLAEALIGGLVGEAVDRAREALREALTAHDLRIIGVTDFVGDEPPPEVAIADPAQRTAPPDPRLPGADSHCPPLTPIRLEEMAA
jgi:methylmalonyl-CoA mutase